MANLVAGPALFRFFDLDDFSTYFDITASQQLEDASFSVETGVFELRSQRTFVSEKDIQTGKDATIEISCADIGNVPLLATALATEVVGTGADQSIVVKDDSGLEFPYKRLLILPYAGAEITQDPRRWIYCPFVQLRATLNLTFGLETQQAFTISAMPKADANDVKMVIGSRGLTLYGFPDPRNSSPSPSPTFDTTLDSDNLTAAGVTLVLLGGDTTSEYRFNAIASPTGTALSMDITIGGNAVAAVNTVSAYTGSTFNFLYQGTLYTGTVADGTVVPTEV